MKRKWTAEEKLVLFSIANMILAVGLFAWDTWLR